MTELVRAIRDPSRIGDVPILKSELSQVRGHPHIEAALDSVRGYEPTVDITDLKSKAAGTFGRAFYDFMMNAGLRPIIPTDHLPKALIQANSLNDRMARTHDMVHVLLGCDTSWPGECGVWGFVGGQNLAGRLNFAARLAVWVAVLRCPHRLFEAIRLWRKGWLLGTQCKLLLAVRLEDHFDQPLDKLRQSLGIHPISSL